MKSYKSHLISLGAASFGLLLAGCWQKSLHPYYKPADVMDNPALVGSWSETDKKPEDAQTWIFTQDRGKSYRLIIQTGDSKLEYQVHAFQLGGSQFLNLYSLNRAVSDIPAHNLFRCEVRESKLRLAPLSLGWVRTWVQSHPDSIDHVRVVDPEHPDDPDKGEIVLTARTEALQRFLLKHLGKDDFFDNAAEFDRVDLKQASSPAAGTGR